MPNAGDLLMDRYRILERIGSGGMATVHRAHDERLDRDVAAKVLLPNLADDPTTAARFAREAQALAAASHPGVVAVYDVDPGDAATGREPFFVMELCSGGSLADRLTGDRRLDPADLVPILVSVADGLADLHRRGIVHRDVKPQNILFTADRAKLADFGLAQADGAAGLSELTTPGTAVGTLAYLAPEILAGARASFAADVYGLGVVAFLALTGSLPRPATSMADLIAGSRSPAPAVSSVAPDLGPAFDDIVGRALATRPDDRPHALAFASGLTSALGRWSRDGGPARRAVAEVPVDGADAVADATTNVAMPLDATLAAAPIPAPAPHRELDEPDQDRSELASRIVLVVAIVVLVVAVFALLGALGGRPLGPAVSPPTAPPGSIGSARPSAPASTAPASVAPSTDPAISALNAMDAAIAGARGGPDGLKGKEANDLEARVGDVRRRLDVGDRAGALDAARKLEKRVGDLSKGLSGDRADRLQTAAQDLVRALGG